MAHALDASGGSPSIRRTCEVRGCFQAATQRITVYRGRTPDWVEVCDGCRCLPEIQAAMQPPPAMPLPDLERDAHPSELVPRAHRPASTRPTLGIVPGGRSSSSEESPVARPRIQTPPLELDPDPKKSRRLCRLVGCQKPAKARGLCATDLERARRDRLLDELAPPAGRAKWRLVASVKAAPPILKAPVAAATQALGELLTRLDDVMAVTAEPSDQGPPPRSGASSVEAGEAFGVDDPRGGEISMGVEIVDPPPLGAALNPPSTQVSDAAPPNPWNEVANAVPRRTATDWHLPAPVPPTVALGVETPVEVVEPVQANAPTTRRGFVPMDQLDEPDGCGAPDCEDGYTPQGTCTECEGMGADYEQFAPGDNDTGTARPDPTIERLVGRVEKLADQLTVAVNLGGLASRRCRDMVQGLMEDTTLVTRTLAGRQPSTPTLRERARQLREAADAADLLLELPAGEDIRGLTLFVPSTDGKGARLVYLDLDRKVENRAYQDLSAELLRLVRGAVDLARAELLLEIRSQGVEVEGVQREDVEAANGVPNA